MKNETMIENIRSLCKKENITPSRLEEILGFSQGLISRWKDKTPSLDRVIDIADYFHVSLDELVGRSQSKPKNENYNFINNLISLTQNKTVEWRTMMDMYYPYEKDGYRYIHDVKCNIKGFNDYPYDDRNRDIFILKYSETFITLWSHLIINHNAIELYDFSLYIQPNADAEPVYQKCNQEQLLSLYHSIKKSLGIESPEVLANKFKEELEQEQGNNMLLEFQNNISKAKIPNPDEVDTFFNKKGMKETLAAINDEPLKNIIETFTNPQMLNMIESVSRLQKHIQSIEAIKKSTKVEE